MTNPINPMAPVFEQPGDYPKMLYRFDGQFPDEDSLKAALAPGGGVRSVVVADAAQEADAIANGWTAFPTDFVAQPGEVAPAVARRAAKKASAE